MKLVIAILSVATAVSGYNILCIHSVPTKSHYHLMMGLITPLLQNGHQITLITTFPESKPLKNLTFIDISHVKKVSQTVIELDMIDRTKQSMSFVMDFAANISKAVIQTPAVRELLVKEQFDAVISEWFFSDIEAGYAAVQQAPWILLAGTVLHTHMEYLIDTVRTVPTIPALKHDSPIPMSFMGRIENTFAYLFMSYMTFSRYPSTQAAYDHYFSDLASARGLTLPPFSSALHNISIMFVNSHPSFAPAQSLPPNVVDIGGYHINEDVPPLPKDLQEILESSSQGVVYFSMGSVLKSSLLPEKVKRDMVKIFGELPYTVLWKFEEQLKNLPANVHIRSWMPQTSILAHKNTKVFITHGGLLSTLESLQWGIPLINIPVFGDQPTNAQRSKRAGHALTVPFTLDIGDDLKEALHEMLHNDSYYNKAKYISRLFRNRPVKTTKLIQHYVELAIESKGAYHLRSKTHLYEWYELWMLDQLALLLAVIFFIYRLLKNVFSLCTNKKNVISKKKKKL